MGWTGGVRFLDKKGIFHFFHRVQTGCQAHPASYPMGIEDYFYPRLKQQRREADRSPPSSAEIKNGGAIPPLPICVHGIVLN
jgi:hypothetical protein